MVAACDAWRAAPEVAPALAEFERYGAGAPLAACPALRRVFSDDGAAPRLVATLVRSFCAALASEPFGHPPLRHGFERGVSTMLLARSGRAQLVLHGREPGSWTFDCVGLSDAERHEAVLAGAAEARVVRRTVPSGAFAQLPLVLHAGTRLALDLTGEALQILHVDRRLVSLRLHRRAAIPGPAYEHALADGALRHQSAGDIRVSRHEAMLALLGRMQRGEAAATMAAIAREPGDGSLRWQALRECLALDAETGFAALCDIAGAADDPLAVPAGSLRAQLIDTHPELAALAEVPCRA